MLIILTTWTTWTTWTNWTTWTTWTTLTALTTRATLTTWTIRKASLFFGGRSEKRLGRISPPQSSVIGGRMHSEEEGEEALLTRL